MYLQSQISKEVVIYKGEARMKSRLLLLLVVCFILLSACASGSQADFSED